MGSFGGCGCVLGCSQLLSIKIITNMINYYHLREGATSSIFLLYVDAIIIYQASFSVQNAYTSSAAILWGDLCIGLRGLLDFVYVVCLVFSHVLA